MSAALLDHLWQSTLFAAAIWPIMPARFVSALQPVAIPFSAHTPVLAVPAPHPMLIDLAAAAWIAGGAAVLGLWLLRSLKLRAHLREADLLPVAAAVPVKSTPSTLEPGLVGIWRPVILLPEGIAEKLSPTE